MSDMALRLPVISHLVLHLCGCGEQRSLVGSRVWTSNWEMRESVAQGKTPGGWALRTRHARADCAAAASGPSPRTLRSAFVSLLPTILPVTLRFFLIPKASWLLGHHIRLQT